MSGFIFLHRKLIKSRAFHNPGILKLWIWCLLKANHKDEWVPFKTGKGDIEVFVKRGQFIFGRRSAAKELKMNPNTIWKRMQKLKNMQNCNLESNRQYTLVTIINYDSYQNPKNKSNLESIQQVSSKYPASNTNNNDNNDNNDNKNKYSRNSIEFRLSSILFQLIKSRNNGHKPPDLQKWSKQIDLMIRIDKRNPCSVLNVICWSQKDEFWQNNILSTTKLRQHFDKLWLQLQKESKKPKTPEEILKNAKSRINRYSG